MKGSYHSIETVWGYLAGIGVTDGLLSALVALIVMGGVGLLGIRLYRAYRAFQVRGGVSGVRTRKKVRSLREEGHLDGKFTFAHAVELAETGTIRRKSLEDKIVNCVVPIEMLFSSDDHGLIYQFEMGEWDETDVASWFEVTKALDLPEIAKIMEEVVLIHDVVTHPEYDPETKHGDATLGDVFYKRASEMRAKIENIDGIARLRAACERHLRKNAPNLLPLPTW